MNIFSPNCLSPAMQLDKNTQDIKTLFANQPQIYYTSEDLDASDTTTPLSTTDITDVDNIGNQPILISANGRLYKITSIVDSTVYCKYEATLPQGDGFNFTGSWVSGNEYHKNDVVTYTSNNITTAYILITNSLNGSTTPPPLDTTNWTVFTSGGLSNWHKIIKTYASYSECYNDLLAVFRRNPAAILTLSIDESKLPTSETSMQYHTEYEGEGTGLASLRTSLPPQRQSEPNYQLHFSTVDNHIILLYGETSKEGVTLFYTFYFYTSKIVINLEELQLHTYFGNEPPNGVLDTISRYSYTIDTTSVLSAITFSYFTFD